jgi:hypothetical protein
MGKIGLVPFFDTRSLVTTTAINFLALVGPDCEVRFGGIGMLSWVDIPAYFAPVVLGPLEISIDDDGTIRALSLRTSA